MHNLDHFSLWTFFCYRYNWVYIILSGGIVGLFSGTRS